LKGLDELSIVSNPILSIEMLIIRLIHLKDMPSYESVLDLVNKNEQNDTTTSNKLISEQNIIEKKKLHDEKEINRVSKDQIKNTTQTKPELNSLNIHSSTKDNNVEKISSLEDLIKLSSRKREIELKYDLEKNVNLIKFSNGKIDISFNENLAKNFVKNLSAKLLEWTGKRWLITLTKAQGQKTFSELNSIKKEELLEEEKNGEIYKRFKSIFSDAELIEVLKKD
jgi:DNA polymerase-3 subunit gamma/tau